VLSEFEVKHTWLKVRKAYDMLRNRAWFPLLQICMSSDVKVYIGKALPHAMMNAEQAVWRLPHVCASKTRHGVNLLILCLTHMLRRQTLKGIARNSVQSQEVMRSC
jgi:hypothetical protein